MLVEIRYGGADLKRFLVVASIENIEDARMHNGDERPRDAPMNISQLNPEE
jgi:hypothetical protein